MKISVLTPCRDAAGTIAHTIESFLAQRHPDKEMIVLDGASRDATRRVVEGFGSNRIRFVSAADRGMYDGLNNGLKLYRGDAVGVLNADDRYRDNRVLSRIAEGLSAAEIVHGHLDFVADQTGRRVTRRWRARPQPAAGFRSGWMPAHPTFYVRRHVAAAVGDFDLSLKTAADYDWMMRAMELHSFSVALVDHVLVEMAMGGRSTRSVIAHIRHNLEALRARRKWLDAGPVDYALLAKPLRKLRQFVVPMRQPERS